MGGSQADGGSCRNNTGLLAGGASAQLRVKASHAFEHRLTSLLFKARTSDALDDPITPCANASTRALNAESRMSAFGAHGAFERDLLHPIHDLARVDFRADQFRVLRTVEVPDFLRTHSGDIGQRHPVVAVAPHDLFNFDG